LRELAAALNQLANTTDQVGGAHEAFNLHGISLDAERLAAEGAGWADGRSFTFHRALPVSADAVWRYLTDVELLAQWWAPEDLRVSKLVFEARPGGRVVLEYRDAEDGDDSDLAAGRSEGVVTDVLPGERLAYSNSPVLPDGSTAFTAHVDYALRPTDAGTDLDVQLRITDSTVSSADFIAGIELGFGQSLDKLAATLAATSRTTTKRRPK
jgi:uncharacterized protein YndB with AHSA1/START domain